MSVIINPNDPRTFNKQKKEPSLHERVTSIEQYLTFLDGNIEALKNTLVVLMQKLNDQASTLDSALKLLLVESNGTH